MVFLLLGFMVSGLLVEAFALGMAFASNGAKRNIGRQLYGECADEIIDTGVPQPRRPLLMTPARCAR